jgi:uncharacterized protein (TIGR00730 family)
MDRLPRYRTGRSDLDEQIADLVDAAEVGRDADLVFEMVASCIRTGREAADRGELKLINSALKELRYSLLVFEPYEEIRKLSIFGSARTREDDAGYVLARELGAAVADAGWMVITGAGPGIMAAGIEGAGADQAFGVNIVLPFESEPNPFLAGDPKLINYRYFFTRKLTFMKESSAFALLPGGFGTMDEAFELLTLLQTGRMPLAPVVMLDEPDGSYWSTWRSFVEDELADRGLVSADDLDLVHLVHDVDAAMDHVMRFYSTFHSQRYVGRRLVLRLHRLVSDDELSELNADFADIVVSGKIQRIEPTDAERRDGDHLELPRLAFEFDRASFARLRRLVDRLNTPR